MSTISGLGYSIVSVSYTSGAAGDITISGSTVTIDKNQTTAITTPLGGDPTVYSFVNSSGDINIVLGQYSVTGTHYWVFDPSTHPWTLLTTTTGANWPAIKNLYGIVAKGSYLYAIDFDGANVAQIDPSTSSYMQKASYNFVYGVPGYASYGEGLADVGDDYLYALFITTNDFTTYQPSTVVQLSLGSPGLTQNQRTPATGSGSVALNAVSIVPFGTDLFIPCIGGRQLAGGYHVDSALQWLDTTATAIVASTGLTVSNSHPGDYRDVTFKSNGTAYYLTGFFSTSYTSFKSKIWTSSASNIKSGTYPGSYSASDTQPGSFFGILYQEYPTTPTPPPNNLWFGDGVQIKIYQPPFTLLTTKTGSQLGTSPIDVNLSNMTPLYVASGGRVTKSFAGQARLAREARQFAKQLRDKNKGKAKK